MVGRGVRVAAAIGIVVAAAIPAAPVPAHASGYASASAACSSVRVDAGRYGGKQTLRVVTIGRVSCPSARHVTRLYYRRMAAGKCGRLNNFCDLILPGGWSCSIFSATEVQETGGAGVGCARGSARIRLFGTNSASRVARTGTSAAATLHLARFLSPDRVSCVIERHVSLPFVNCNVGNFAGNGFRSATLQSDGGVQICNHPSPRANYCGALGRAIPRPATWTGD